MTDTQLDSENRPGLRRRRCAVAAAGALTIAGLGMVNAAPANAAAQSAGTGSFQWGIKESFINYHIRHSANTQTLVAGDGATAGTTTRTVGALASSPAEQVPTFWDFPFVSGSYDSATNSYTAQYGGYVELRESNPAPSAGPTSASPLKNFRFSNPKVVIDLDTATKSLVVDVAPGDDGDLSSPPTAPSDNADFGTFPSLTTEATESGGSVTYTNLATVLTAAGSSSFNGFYNAGDPLDPVTTSLSGLTGGGPPPPPPSGGNAGTVVQQLQVTLGNTNRFLMTVNGGNNPVAFTAGQDEGNFVNFTAALNPITVSDTRAAGSWSLVGQASNFTSGSDTLNAGHLGWTPNTTAGTAGAPVAPGTTSTDGLAVSRPMANGNAGQSATVGADMRLRVPSGTNAGAYGSTITTTATTT